MLGKWRCDQGMEQKTRVTSEQARVAAAMNALAHPRRMLVFDALTAAPDGLRYGDLLERTGLSISTLNHHLRPMRAARLVATRRKGKEMIYRAHPSAVSPHLRRVLAAEGPP